MNTPNAIDVIGLYPQCLYYNIYTCWAYEACKMPFDPLFHTKFMNCSELWSLVCQKMRLFFILKCFMLFTLRLMTRFLLGIRCRHQITNIRSFISFDTYAQSQKRSHSKFQKEMGAIAGVDNDGWFLSETPFYRRNELFRIFVVLSPVRAQHSSDTSPLQIWTAVRLQRCIFIAYAVWSNIPFDFVCYEFSKTRKNRIYF